MCCATDSTLKGAFPGKLSVLIIDQVDAVSEVSGREGQVREVLFRLITDAHNFGGIKIVVACRTFDLENDARFRDWKKNDLSTQIDVPLLNWKNDVAPLLVKKGFKTAAFTAQQRKLLCLPVYLAVYLEIGEPGLQVQSGSKLFEKLLEKKQRILHNERRSAWPLINPLMAMCEWMNRCQKLNAPVSVLDAYAGASNSGNPAPG